jgi:bla regulator protein blaR1
VNYLSILEVFVSLSVQVAAVIGVAALVARSSRSAADADACWSALHVCILLLTAAAFFLPHVRLITWADIEPNEGHPIADSAVSIIGQTCAWLWVSGTTLFLAICVGGMFRATSLVRKARIDARIAQIGSEDLTGEPSLARIETRVSSEDVSPFCWQFHNPVIVLPEVVRSFPQPEQAAILRHERAHLRLQHPLHLFLQRIVEAIYWFHPFVWWASRQAAAAREFRCDRDSVRSKHEVADYLRSLLRLIESKVHPPGKLPAGIGFIGDATLLSQRANILGEYVEHFAAPANTRRAVILLVACAAICSLLWLPVNPNASRRSEWSPWPTWSARMLNVTGVVVRDYEVDGHRLSLHNHE